MKWFVVATASIALAGCLGLLAAQSPAPDPTPPSIDTSLESDGLPHPPLVYPAEAAPQAGEIRRPVLLGLLAGVLVCGFLAVAAYRAKSRPAGAAFVLGALVLLTAVATIRMWGVTRLKYPFPELNDPPTRRPPTEIPEGTVQRGQTVVRTADGHERPYLWLWFERGTSDCPNFRWYQFVRVEITCDGQRIQSDRAYPAATGRDFHLNRWEADYHPAEVLSSDPPFSPDGLGVPAVDPGKPFKHYSVPGTRTGGGTSELDGILDAPNFCERRDARTVSPVEAIVQPRIRPQEVTQRNPPPGRTSRVVVTVSGRSYLVCIQDGATRCVGFVPWTYTQEIDLAVEYTRSPSTDLGIDPVWKVGTRIAGCANRLDIGDWQRCP